VEGAGGGNPRCAGLQQEKPLEGRETSRKARSWTVDFTQVMKSQGQSVAKAQRLGSTEQDQMRELSLRCSLRLIGKRVSAHEAGEFSGNPQGPNALRTSIKGRRGADEPITPYIDFPSMKVR
jgi:predicted component of type VI protein secretion system